MSDAKQNQQTTENRTYYQSVYGQIHASEELKERLINMNKMSKSRTSKATRRITWKAAAAAAALAIVLPTGAYAADHYWGITDFFRQSGHTLTDEAGRLVETDIAQTPQKTGAETEPLDGTDQSASELPVTFTVQEALCDSGTVNIVIEAKAAESGRYLLVPDHCISEEDSVEDIGIHEDTSIGAYAKAKGLEILYVNSGFAPYSPFFPASCEYSSKSVQDDILNLFISADREKSDIDLNAVLSHSIRPAAGSDQETLKAFSTCELKDMSTSRMYAYLPKESGTVPTTQAVVQKVTMEQTEVNTYVDIYYQNPQGMEEDNGLYFAVVDDSGNEWPFKSGRGIVQQKDGSYCLRLCYDKTELPKNCVLKAYDYIEKNIYGQIVLMQTE